MVGKGVELVANSGALVWSNNVVILVEIWRPYVLKESAVGEMGFCVASYVRTGSELLYAGVIVEYWWWKKAAHAQHWLVEFMPKVVVRALVGVWLLHAL